VELPATLVLTSHSVDRGATARIAGTRSY
jgi:hypothetical protein